jgi:hypothetical protein
MSIHAVLSGELLTTIVVQNDLGMGKERGQQLSLPIDEVLQEVCANLGTDFVQW